MSRSYSTRKSLEGIILFIKSGYGTTWIFVLSIIMNHQVRKVFLILFKSYGRKKHNNQQQRQASDAISLYYGTELSNSKNRIATKKKYKDSTLKKDQFKLTHADWTSVYNDLNAEIKLRHYSPKTLRAYRGWARQFQSYTKSKDPKLLSPSDVKDFLTFLAVKQKVSAEAQRCSNNDDLYPYD